MENQELLWANFRKQIGYTDEELEEFKKNSKRVRLVERTPELLKYRIVAEVIRSHGCTIGHKVGDKFIMSGMGTLETRKCPDHICMFALSYLSPFVAMIQDRISEGLDPNGLVYDRVSCMDVGLECGGWGQISMKVYAEKKT